jgi:Kef-type K+ transport system membrane component KefB
MQIAWAPIARALRTSVPRRNPPSTITGIRPAAFAISIIVLLGRIFLRLMFRLVAATRSSEMFIAVCDRRHRCRLGHGRTFDGAWRFCIRAAACGNLIPKSHRSDDQAFQGASAWPGGTVLIALKAAVLTVAGRLFNLPWPVAVETGLLLGPAGEFAFAGYGRVGKIVCSLLKRHGIAYTTADHDRSPILLAIDVLTIPVCVLAAGLGPPL